MLLNKIKPIWAHKDPMGPYGPQPGPGPVSSSACTTPVMAVKVASVAEAQSKLERSDLSSSEVIGLLAYLDSLTIDAHTMATTKIPQTLTAVKKRYASVAAIHTAAKKLLAKWKLIFQQEKEEQRRKDT